MQYMYIHIYYINILSIIYQTVYTTCYMLQCMYYIVCTIYVVWRLAYNV